MTVIFCVPGNNFSTTFVRHWSGLLQWCGDNGVRYGCSIEYDPIIYNARNRCLKGDICKGKDQKPFGGTVDYDYIMWIDSDIIFEPAQLARLLNHEKDIVSGLYLMSNCKEYATANPWAVKESEEIQRSVHLTPADLEQKEELIEVPYTGFGFMLIKKGVFESLEYPWFRPLYSKINGMDFFAPEDSGFCEMVQKRGFKVYVDPTIVVGHEKRMILK